MKQGGYGDAVGLTGLLRDLRAARADVRFHVTGVRAQQVFARHPGWDAAVLNDAIAVDIDYGPTIDRVWAGGTGYYLDGPRESFTRACGFTPFSTGPLPELFLGPGDEVRPDDRPYWVVLANTRWDCPLKQWPPRHFAEVIALTADTVRWKQCGNAHDGRFAERSWPLPGVENLLGQTDFRALVRLVAHATGVLTHQSLGYFLAAAFRKPCIVLAGGREPPGLYQVPAAVWPELVLIHTIGKYDCCKTTGCGKRYPVPVHTDSAWPEGILCVLPVPDAHAGYVARCMAETRPADVAAHVLRLNATAATDIMC